MPKYMSRHFDVIMNLAQTMSQFQPAASLSDDEGWGYLLRLRNYMISQDSFDENELDLMGQLLEDAYGRRAADETAAELLSQLKFYLHKKQIDVVDFEDRMTYGQREASGQSASGEDLSIDRDRRSWFDMIPAYAAGTIRPALVRDGKLLKKGLASEGR